MDPLPQPEKPASIEPLHHSLNFARVLLIVIIAVVFASIFGIAMYALGKASSQPAQNNAATPTTTAPSAMPTIDPTADWKIYTNTAYSFTTKYPPTWSTKETKNSVSFINPQNQTLTISYKKATDPTRIVRTGVGAGDITSQGTILFGGQTLQRNVLIYNNQVRSVLYNDAAEIPINQFAFSISLDANDSADLSQETQNTADQILSTFKFTDQATTTDTSTWKTYTFKNPAIQFSYPTHIQLKQQYENYVILTDKGSSLSIKAGDHPFGIESPNAQVSSAPIIVNGKPLELFKKQVYKTRVDYKGENQTNFIIDLQSNTGEKIALISYNFKNDIIDEKENRLFDQILSTFKFTQ